MPRRSAAGGGAGRATENPLAALLVRRLTEEGREPGASVTVAALCKNLLPYTVCRDALGVASKGEYDVALLRFMRDGGALSLDRELAKAVDTELANPEPGLAFLKNFAAAKVVVHVGLDRLEQGRVDLDKDTLDDLDELMGVMPADADDRIEETPGEPAGEAEQTMTGAASEDVARCTRCDEELPTDREVLFCPYCGQDQSLVICIQCSEELSAEWRFCPRCGTAAERS